MNGSLIQCKWRAQYAYPVQNVRRYGTDKSIDKTNNGWESGGNALDKRPSSANMTENKMK